MAWNCNLNESFKLRINSESTAALKQLFNVSKHSLNVLEYLGDIPSADNMLNTQRVMLHLQIYYATYTHPYAFFRIELMR